MIPVKARAIYIKSEASVDARSMARIQRMLPFMRCATAPEIVDDAALHRIVQSAQLNNLTRHGQQARTIEPIVIFNQFLYQHAPAARQQREERFPELFRGGLLQYAGYGGWDWRRSGDAEFRRTTGLVCQPAYAMHSFWGCHFRCVYCDLGHVANIFVNLEDWIEQIRAGLANLENAPDQRLFQWDNGTDVVCWEPEYCGTRLLVDLFARQADKYLELYVGKSDYVDYLLDYDHRGHTVCCWSIGTETQCRLIEPRTAGMEARLAAARKCQQAGYPVRIRLSPMVPLCGWQEEMRHLLRRMFEEITPDVITMEPLRFYTHAQLLHDFPAGSLDPEFMTAMAQMPKTQEGWAQSEFPEDCRLRIYRLVLDEIARLAPNVPVALCREQRRVWDLLADDFQRMGQHPDDFVCNCGPQSVGADRRLLAAHGASSYRST